MRGSGWRRTDVAKVRQADVVIVLPNTICAESNGIDRQPRYHRLAPLDRWLCVPAFRRVCQTFRIVFYLCPKSKLGVMGLVRKGGIGMKQGNFRVSLAVWAPIQAHRSEGVLHRHLAIWIYVRDFPPNFVKNQSFSNPQKLCYAWKVQGPHI